MRPTAISWKQPKAYSNLGFPTEKGHGPGRPEDRPAEGVYLKEVKET